LQARLGGQRLPADAVEVSFVENYYPMRDKAFKEQRRALREERRKAALGKFGRRKRSGSVLAGFLLLCIGALLLAKEFGVPFPGWFFSWPMIVIAFGLLAGAGNAFRDPGWVIITGVGTVFLLDKIWPTIPIHHFIWPVVIIAIGFIIILAPRRHRLWHARWHEKRDEDQQKWHEQRAGELNKWHQQRWQQPQEVQDPNIPQEPGATESREKYWSDNWLETVTIFGNVKKLVYSKNFKGGDIVSIFGGSEINLTHADFKGNIVIELVQIFGGAKLIIPPHWQVRSEMVAIFGGIDDKRPPQPNYDPEKVIILNGTTLFGGIEIKSY
jgi:predicted membrane protein